LAKLTLIFNKYVYFTCSLGLYFFKATRLYYCFFSMQFAGLLIPVS